MRIGDENSKQKGRVFGLARRRSTKRVRFRGPIRHLAARDTQGHRPENLTSVNERRRATGREARLLCSFSHARGDEKLHIPATEGSEMTNWSARVHHVVITVTDIDVSRRWYRELFGVDPVIDGPVEPLPGHHRGYYHVVFPLPGGLLFGLHLHAATAEDESFSEFRPGLDHVAFAADSRREIKAWEERLSELGIDNSGIVEDRHGLNLSFRDPDNIALEVWAPLA